MPGQGGGVGGEHAAQRRPAQLGGAQAVVDDRARRTGAVGLGGVPQPHQPAHVASWPQSPRFTHTATESKSAGSGSCVARCDSASLKAGTTFGRWVAQPRAMPGPVRSDQPTVGAPASSE
ncbi:hypothetical protein SMICM17S_01340 [Streptomyces microflavus]